jgi:glycogen(starch) synthase
MVQPEPLRIAFFCPPYEQLGGFREIGQRLVAGFVRRGHEVTVVARAARGAARGPLVDPATGARLLRVRLAPTPGAAARFRAWRRFGKHFPESASALVRSVRRTRADLLVTFCSKFYGPHVAFVRALARVPVVVHMQNAARTADGPDSPRLMRMLLRCGARVVAATPAVADYARSMLPERPADAVVWVPNGVELEAFTAVEPERRAHPYVLAVGRLADQKGFDVLIDAFARADLPLELLIAGEGPDREPLARQAAARGLGERVHLLGEVDRPRLARLLAGTTLVAIPSRFEGGGPLVALEAMAAGRPIVISRIPGIHPDLRHGETAWLVPPEDPEALAAALRELVVVSPERARALGAAGLALAKRLPDWDAVTDRMLEIYDGARRPRR